MLKKRLFIGSSFEELDLAGKVKKLLEEDFDVTIWNENVWDKSVFKLNQGFLSDLLKASLQFDFGILLGTTDDSVIVRGEEVLKPRDNVLFELGLFTGRLGTSKCAFLIDEKVKLPSDFSGISLAKFDRTNNHSLEKAVHQIKELFQASTDEELNFFPSATLASVYYENLIVPICRHVINIGGFKRGEITYKKCRLNIIIPERINQDVNLQFEKLKSLFTTENISFKYAGRPRQISIDTKIENDTLELIDFPTIITGINQAISNLLPKEFNKQRSDYEAILDRELRRFITTLKLLLIKGGFDEIVHVKREEDFKK